MVAYLHIGQPAQPTAMGLGNGFFMPFSVLPNVPNLPNLVSRRRRCAHGRARTRVCAREYGSGTLGRLGKTNTDKGLSVPNHFFLVGQVGQV